MVAKLFGLVSTPTSKFGMPGLSSSRWALKDGGRSSSMPAPSSRTPASTRARTDENKPVHFGLRPDHDASAAAAELSRYSMIVRRMKWKLPFLDWAYRQATSSEETAEAEMMFKLDFFEYYMLCERALVHLQGVYGITISRNAGLVPRTTAAGNSEGTTRHRYHANVLEALDHKGNPLHVALGVGEVRQQLARAKELRNRWKKAGDEGGDGSSPANGGAEGKKQAPPLAAYDLSGILASIHQGLDQAFAIADAFVATEIASSSGGGADKSQSGLLRMDEVLNITEEERWVFMAEAMDWEAV